MSHSQDPGDIIKTLSGFSAESLKNDPNTRREALSLSIKLWQTLANPYSEAVELFFQPYKTIVNRIAADLDLFQLVEDAGGHITTKELSEKSGGDERLIERIMRLLAGLGFVNHVSKNTWSATPTTKAMSVMGIKAGNRFTYDFMINAAITIPAFLRQTKFREPIDPSHGIVQHAFNTDLQAFEYLTKHPHMLRDFNNFMGFGKAGRGFWTDWYPVEERILQDYDPATALLVDVGGGKGHDVTTFHEQFPGRGRLVLQDLMQAREEDFKLDEGIEQMVHNFYELQPVVGARVYFLHHILHDWPDASCLAILAHLRAAMTPGYSKLLIHDLILPDIAPTSFQTIWDWAMMTFTAGAERNEAWWRELMEEAGLEIVKFWRGSDEEADGIVEVVRKE